MSPSNESMLPQVREFIIKIFIERFEKTMIKTQPEKAIDT